MDKKARDTGRKAKFEKTIEEAWKKACQTYLKESGLDEDSPEWKAILATKCSQEVIDILNETWGNRKSHFKDDSQFVGSSTTPDSKTPKGFRASLKRVSNRFIGRKDPGHILRLPAADKNAASQSVIDKRVDLKQKLSGKPPKGKGLVDAGAEGINIISSASQSDALKTIVDQVESFSGALQDLVSLCQPVTLPIFLHLLRLGGTVCTYCFGLHSSVFQGYAFDSLLKTNVRRLLKICGNHTMSLQIYFSISTTSKRE